MWKKGQTLFNFISIMRKRQPIGIGVYTFRCCEGCMYQQRLKAWGLSVGKGGGFKPNYIELNGIRRVCNINQPTDKFSLIDQDQDCAHPCPVKVSDSLLQANSNIEVSQHQYQTYPILFADIIVKFNSVLGLPIISNLSISDYISVDIGQHHPNNYIL